MKILIKELGVTLQGEATITGTVTFQQHIVVSQNIYVSGNIYIRGNLVQDSSALDIVGNATFGQTLSAENIIVSNDAIITDNLYIYGNLFNDNLLSTHSLNVTNNATIVGTFLVSDSVSFNNDLQVDGPAEFNDLVTINTLEVINNASIGTTFYVEDGATFNSDLLVNGIATFANSLIANSNLIINGTFYADQPATFNSELLVNGKATFANSLIANSNLIINGTFYADQPATFNSELLVNGKATFANSLIANSNLIINGTFYADQPATFNSELLVNGKATFANSLIANSNLIINGTFYADQAATFNSDLLVNGKATFANSLISNSNLIINGTFYADQAATFNSDLLVNGKATFSNSLIANSNLLINGTFYANQGATFNSDLLVNGIATFTNSLIANSNLIINGTFYGAQPATFNTFLRVNGTATFGSNIGADSIIVTNNGLIGGTFLVQGAVTCNSGLYVSGPIGFNNSSILVSGNLLISGGLVVTGNSTFNNIFVSGIHSISGGLIVTGNSTFSNVLVSGLLNVTGGLVVSSNGTFNSISVKDIYVNNTLSTARLLNYVKLDYTSTTFTATFGDNVYLAIATYSLNLISQTGIGINDASVNAIGFKDNDVILGGSFTTTYTRIVRALGGVTLDSLSTGFNANVRTVKGGTGAYQYLYAGGDFSLAFGANSGGYVAFYENNVWNSYGGRNSDSNAPTFNAAVYSIITNKDEKLWIGSTGFTNTPPGNTGNINRLGRGPGGANKLINRGGSMDGAITSLLLDKNQYLYVAGKGITKSPNNDTNIRNIMFSNDYDFYTDSQVGFGTWNNMNGGLGTMTDGVNCLAVDSENNIYAGGDFTTINIPGQPSCNYIAKWNGTKWSPMGNGVTYVVNTIAIDNRDSIFVGTNGLLGGGNIYRWNGRVWINVATTNGPIQSLAFDNSNPQKLYVGGAFNNFTNCSRFTRFVLPYKTINIDGSNTVYDNSLGNPISSIILKDIGESITINANGTYGYVLNSSPNLSINYS